MPLLATMPLLAIANLSKRYGYSPALRNLSLELDVGDALLVIGPNGAGKTTLLECIAGVLRPDAGTIVWNRLNSLGRTLVGYVSQSTMLYGDLTIAENISLHAALSGASNAEETAAE